MEEDKSLTLWRNCSKEAENATVGSCPMTSYRAPSTTVAPAESAQPTTNEGERVLRTSPQTRSLKCTDSFSKGTN